METVNPYAAPQDESRATSETSVPMAASRRRRFFGHLIDMVIVGGIYFIIGKKYFPALLVTSDIAGQLLGILLTVVIWFICNYWFLSSGQTIGKKLLRTQVVMNDGRAVTSATFMGYRFGMTQFIMIFGIIGAVLGFLDACFIFGKEKRCVHDRIADTKVVRKA